MSGYKIIGKSGVGGVFAQSSLELVCRRAAFRGEPSDRHAISGDHDRLPVLDSIEEVSEVARSLGSGHRYHEYILSDQILMYVTSDRG